MKVFIAAPYTEGDVAMNVKRAIDAADMLLDAGYLPFVPHLTHFWHIISPKPYKVWTALDLEFLPLCDAVLRLSGDSDGADDEVALARKLGIPVYYKIMDLLEGEHE